MTLTFRTRKRKSYPFKIGLLNPLNAEDKISRPGNLTFLKSSTPRRVPNTLPSKKSKKSENPGTLRG